MGGTLLKMFQELFFSFSSGYIHTRSNRNTWPTTPPMTSWKVQYPTLTRLWVNANVCRENVTGCRVKERQNFRRRILCHQMPTHVWCPGSTANLQTLTSGEEWRTLASLFQWASHASTRRVWKFLLGEKCLGSWIWMAWKGSTNHYNISSENKLKWKKEKKSSRTFVTGDFTLLLA